MVQHVVLYSVIWTNDLESDEGQCQVPAVLVTSVVMLAEGHIAVLDPANILEA
jgi:hypothetical protein